MKASTLSINIVIIVVSALLFIPNLGAVHLFDWDEINFAECAREMIVTGNYSQVMINYEAFWEKPPLFFWMQVIAMKIFGANEFAARLPNAICGMFTLLAVYNIGAKHFNQKMASFWVLAFAGSFLPHFYFKSGIIDPWFNLFIFLGIYYFISYSSHYVVEVRSKNKIPYLLFSALFIGLAVLTKGPVALLIFGLCFLGYLLISRFKQFFGYKEMLLWTFIVALTGSSWFLVEIARGRFDIVVEFFEYQVRLFNTQDAGHGGPFYYHFLVLLIGCFPASILMIRGFKKIGTAAPFKKYLKLWMIILFWVVLILFSIVKTKIVHYSSLTYFPITFLAAWTFNFILERKLEWKKWMTVLTGIIGIVLGIAITLLPFVAKYKANIITSGIIKDDFALANLQADVYWNGFEFLIGLSFLIFIVVAIYFFNTKRIATAISLVFAASLITVNFTILVFVPKIEKYSQGAAIEFYRHFQNKDVYIEPLFFKSYAQLYYSDKKPVKNPLSYDIQWLLNGDVDKPVYFVTRVNKENEIKEYYSHLKEVYRKNGFIFYTRNIEVENR
ncbi:MAG: glycosyltransferase family 39 protein [Bacteroidetes bacterium]|nr:glycosyltransferase family 39 protein [Bacteroidota bacterium]HET6243641.1 glycosyltransferase family 39 protein [Bacteroidia bacterium]